MATSVASMALLLPARRARVGQGRARSRPGRAQQVARDESARLRRRDDDLDLVRQLVRERLLDEQRVAADELRVPGELFRGGLAGDLQAVGIRLGDLPPAVPLARGLDAVRVGLGGGEA